MYPGALATSIPATLGRYELLLPVARGGMGQVWVALDTGHLMELRSLLPDEEVRLLRDWDPRGQGSVPDPYYDGEEVFEEVLDIIERSCDGLLEELRRRLAA